MTIHQFPSRSTKDSAITKPLEVVVDGKTWKLFLADYSDGDFHGQIEFYALDMEHAAQLVLAMRQNMALTGELFSRIPA